jgi:hypothetical protein
MSFAPDWSLLPDEPVAFFGLDDDFDRVALKRKYNALLREFKPEKFPAEFQKLRAAYESLESSLRYGQGVPKKPQAAAQEIASLLREADEALKPKVAPVPTNAPVPPPGRPSRPVPQSKPVPGRTFEDGRPVPLTHAPRPSEPVRELLVLLEREPIAAVYKQWQARPAKTAFDYYALALLGDCLDETPATFVRWLLTGVAELDGARRNRTAARDPQADALWDLLREWFTQASTPAVTAGALRFAASHVPGDRFYWLTEPAWLRLAREVPFAKWDGLLKECEAKLTDHRIAHRLEFYLRVFRVVCWDADAEWTANAKTFIDESVLELDRPETAETLQFDILNLYLKMRAAFANHGPLHRRLDEAIRGYFQGDEHSATTCVIACNHWIADNSGEVLKAIPHQENEFAPVWRLWSRITEDVVNEWGEDDSRWSLAQVIACIQNWGLRVAEKSGNHSLSRLDNFTTFLVIDGLFLGVAALLGRIGVLAYRGESWNAWGFAGIEALLLLLAVPPCLWLFIRAITFRSDYVYRNSMRAEIVKLLKIVPVSPDQFSFAFATFRGAKNENLTSGPFRAVVEQFHSDPGLLLYRAAQLMLQSEEALAAVGDEQAITSNVDRYRGIRRQFVDNRPTRRAIDHVLASYSLQDETQRAKAFAEAQLWLAAHPGNVAGDIPPELADGDIILAAWKQLSAKYGSPPPPPSRGMEHIREARANQLAARLAAADNSSIFFVAVPMLLMILVFAGGFCLSCYLFIWTIYVGSDQGLMIGFRWWLLHIGATFWGLALTFALARIGDRARAGQYAASLRRELFMFASSESVSPEEMVEILRSMENRVVLGEKFENSEKLLAQFEQDTGMNLFLLARQFRLPVPPRRT